LGYVRKGKEGSEGVPVSRAVTISFIKALPLPFCEKTLAVLSRPKPSI
jgi:hypothetical protein